MKILKKIGVVIAALIVVICVTSLFFPTAVTVERSIMVEAPVPRVFVNVNQMENWGKWGGPWHEEGMDYNKVIQGYEGPTAGVGSTVIYDQGDGNGTVKVIESEENKRIKTLISFAVGGSANGEWKFEENGSATKVTWGLNVNLGYNPMKRNMGNPMFGGKVGPLFEKGLSNLKQVSE